MAARWWASTSTLWTRDDALRVIDINLLGPAAVGTLVRASLGRPVRDLATTRRGTISYALLCRLPRRLVDHGLRACLRASARAGHFEGGIGAAMVERLAPRRRPT